MNKPLYEQRIVASACQFRKRRDAGDFVDFVYQFFPRQPHHAPGHVVRGDATLLVRGVRERDRGFFSEGNMGTDPV